MDREINYVEYEQDLWFAFVERYNSTACWDWYDDCLVFGPFPSVEKGEEELYKHTAIRSAELEIISNEKVEKDKDYYTYFIEGKHNV